jgi:hypothetical protein
MLSRLEILIDLLHGAGDAALATQSLAMPGYPFVSTVSFATDALQRPILLISRLAEHTQNLLADARASLLLSRPLGDGEMARVTLVGRVVQIDACPGLQERYLRYHPEAERFLQLGDFAFHRFEPERIRVIGGFAQAGWLDGVQMIGAPGIAIEDEMRLLAELPSPREGVLLGVDAYGADLRVAGGRRRLSFDGGPLDAVAAGRVLAEAFSGER